MGAPGAGKGTQAKLIANHFHIPAISTGAIFRSNIAAKTELGIRVNALISRGEFVPDVLTTAVVAKRLLEGDTNNGWLLDGYPRTTEQVEALDIILADAHRALDCVLSLETNEDQLVARMLKRAEIEGRADDNEETIRHRMEVYRAETEPLLAIYRERGLLVGVNGDGTVDEVAERIFAALEEFKTK